MLVQTIVELTILSHPPGPCLTEGKFVNFTIRAEFMCMRLTDEVIEPEQGSSELAVGLHDDPYARANTSINQL